MNVKKSMALLMTVAMTCSLGACGDSKGKETSSTATTKAAGSTAKESSSAAKAAKIKIAWWGGQGRHDYTQKLLDLYAKTHTNITFEAFPAGWDGYFDKLSTQAASGSMPDIVQMDYQYISTFAKNNSVADLQSYIDKGTIDVKNMEPVVYNSGKINGKMAGMVLSTSVLTMGCNENVFKEAGLEVPTAKWTWKDFMNISKTVKEKTGKYGCAAILSDNINTYSYYVRQHGVSLFSKDNKSLGYQDDAIYVDFVKMMMDLIAKGALPNPDQFDAIKALAYEATPVAVGTGAMVPEWSNVGTRMASVNKNIALVPLPQSDAAGANNKALWLKPGMYFSVAERSTLKNEAAEFINWFVNSNEANDVILAERGTPVSSKVREHLNSTGILSEQQLEMFKYVDAVTSLCGDAPAPDPVGISEVDAQFKLTAYSALYGQSTPEKAAATFRKNANEILARSN